MLGGRGEGDQETGKEVNKKQKYWEKKVTRRNEGSKKKKQAMSMKEKGAEIKMDTEGRIDVQRLWKGSGHVREKSVKRKR